MMKDCDAAWWWIETDKTDMVLMVVMMEISNNERRWEKQNGEWL